jgi:hypothetical protein
MNEEKLNLIDELLDLLNKVNVIEIPHNCARSYYSERVEELRDGLKKTMVDILESDSVSTLNFGEGNITIGADLIGEYFHGEISELRASLAL